MQNSYHLERATGDAQLFFVRRLAAGERLILPGIRQPALTQPSRQQRHRINRKLDELGTKPGFQGSSGFACCPAQRIEHGLVRGTCGQIPQPGRNACSHVQRFGCLALANTQEPMRPGCLGIDFQQPIVRQHHQSQPKHRRHRPCPGSHGQAPLGSLSLTIVDHWVTGTQQGTPHRVYHLFWSDA